MQQMFRNRRSGRDRRHQDSGEWNYVCRRRTPDRRRRRYGVDPYQWWPPQDYQRARDGRAGQAGPTGSR